MTRKLRISLCFLGLSLLVPQSAISQTRLGLHVTQEELNIWKQRAQNGPYKTASDVSTNSPGDWTRITNNANRFKNGTHPYEQWAGQTTNACVQPGADTGGIIGNRSLGDAMRDAAFYYLITGDTSYSTLVRNDLLAQTAVAGTNFTNRTKWCQYPAGPLVDEDPTMSISLWLAKLLFAYDYTKGTFTSAQQTTMQNWFVNAATYLVTNYSNWVTPNRYPSRNSGVYSDITLAGAGTCSGGCKGLYNGGPQVDDWIGDSNNRSSAINRTGALVGIMFNNTFLKNQAKMHFKETLMFATFPDGTTSDQSRWEDFGGGVGSDIGWQYAALNIGSLATMADAFARTGDYELVNYSTSAGADGTSGGPKSLSQMVNLFMGYVNHTVNRFTPGHAGNNNYRIDTVDLAAGGSGDTADDHSFSQINLYYKNTTNKSLYMRTASGTPPYPTTYSTGGWEAWNGEWGIYPAPLFMFGQMEGQVLPYPTASSQLPAINFSAVPDIITSGQSSVLTWSTTNATSCAGSGGWTGTIPTSGTQTVTPAQTTTFTLSCTGSAGTATQSTTITVSAPPSAPTNFTVSVAP